MERKTTEKKEREREKRKDGTEESGNPGRHTREEGRSGGRKRRERRKGKHWRKVKSEKCQSPLCLLVIIPGIK